jgi:hypothetical protein
MKILKISSVLFFAMLALASCKKDDKDTVKDLLTSEAWIQSDYRSDDNGDGELTADESDIEDCEKDDATTFEDNGDYSYNDGADVCDPGFPNEGSGTWTLSADEKTLTIEESGITLPFQIVSITNSKLVLRIDFLGLKETTLIH